MDRRQFLAGVGVLPAAGFVSARPVRAGVRSSEDPSERLIREMRGLELWARAMREQFEHAGKNPQLHCDVLPAIARWFGEILSDMARLEQYRPEA